MRDEGADRPTSRGRAATTGSSAGRGHRQHSQLTSQPPPDAADRHVAEDLVQDVLATAYRKWRRVGAADEVDAYVRTMLVRRHVSWRRRRWHGEALGCTVSTVRSQASRGLAALRLRTDVLEELA